MRAPVAADEGRHAWAMALRRTHTQTPLRVHCEPKHLEPKWLRTQNEQHNLVYIYIYIYLSLSLFSAASRDSATAQVYRHLSFLLQNTTEHLAEKSSKSSPNRSQNGAESMKKRPWNDGGAETRFGGVGRKPRNPRPDLWAPFSVAKSQTNMKNAINKLC